MKLSARKKKDFLKTGIENEITETLQSEKSQELETQCRVAVIGGGLVGSMISCFLARRGYKIGLYEMREDPRHAQLVQGKSINLALSERGRSALRALGLESRVLDKFSIKMHSRMIHNLDGTTHAIPYGTDKDHYILSVSRRFLNEMLIDEAEKYRNVSIHFNHKLLKTDLSQGKLTFEKFDEKQKEEIHVATDVVLGCDGAHSAVRRQMIKFLLLNYSQTYIQHGYIELCIPPNKSNDFAMAPNYLHIWPRGYFMMIALPNLDRSFTVTLFMPFEFYDQIIDETTLVKFFEKNFPDSIALLSREGLIKSFFSKRPSSLISIKCQPYNYENRALLMGDAAHAMVPFYGQGMNCGFEDCLVLDELLKKHGNNHLSLILDEYTKERIENCHSIIDLAMYNYIEMRDLVNKKSFLFRKKFDNFAYYFLPKLWIPLYTMVTFTRTPYKKCLEDRRWQDQMIDRFIKIAIFLVSLYALIAMGQIVLPFFQ